MNNNLLKFNGPHRIISTGTSTNQVLYPSTTIISPQKIGETKIYQNTKVIK